MPQRRLAGVLNNKQRARGLAFSPDGRFLAVGSSLRVRLWNLETGTVDQEYSYPGTVIRDVAISPDGAFVAAAADDKTIWITSLTQPGYTLRLGGHEDKVNTVEFSPDGLLLASGGNDNRANLWILEKDPNGLLTAVRQTTFLHEDWVTSVAFSPDSRLLATGSFDNSVAVWDVQNGELVDLPFQQNQNQVLSVTWGPDGTSLAAGTVRGEVHIWKDLVFDK
jgi:WD40 repeat protein